MFPEPTVDGYVKTYDVITLRTIVEVATRQKYFPSIL